jgi:hypothetical protein
LEEQCLIAELGKQTCPHCDCNATHLGDDTASALRTRDDILEQIKKIKRDYKAAYNRPPSLKEFTNLASEQHLNRVDRQFWSSLPQVDIFKMLCPDILHRFHKMFYNHIYHFNLTGMGDDEYDACIRSQVHFAGDCAFPHGVSHISQMTGIEHQALEHTHLPIVANAPGAIWNKVTQATQAAMECIYLVQLPTQSDRSLQAYQAAYKDFMQERWVWVKNRTWKGKNGVIPHFHIPKMHVIRHLVEQVRLKGTADNYSTETMEHLHIDMVKDVYQVSNQQEWKQQTSRWLTQREKIQDFEAWMIWRESEMRKEVARGNGKSISQRQK